MQIRDLIPWGHERNGVSRPSDNQNNPLTSLQRDMNRVFEDFWGRFDRPFRGLNGHFFSSGPTTDVSETDEAVEVSIELPGMDEKDIEVKLTNEVMTIRGEKKEEKEEKKKGFYLSERSYGSFYRTIPLPPGVDSDKASAEFKKGVLTVSLPKSPEAQAKVRRIEVKAA